jgi:hypothetical protein
VFEVRHCHQILDLQRRITRDGVRKKEYKISGKLTENIRHENNSSRSRKGSNNIDRETGHGLLFPFNADL